MKSIVLRYDMPKLIFLCQIFMINQINIKKLKKKTMRKLWEGAALPVLQETDAEDKITNVFIKSFRS